MASYMTDGFGSRKGWIGLEIGKRRLETGDWGMGIGVVWAWVGHGQFTFIYF